MKSKKIHKINFFRKYKKYRVFTNKLSFFCKKSSYINKKELEATRKTLRRYLNKGSKVFIFPQKTLKLTKKSKGARMGKGVGKLRKNEIILTTKGNLLFELREKFPITPYNNFEFIGVKNKISCKLKKIFFFKKEKKSFYFNI